MTATAGPAQEPASAPRHDGRPPSRFERLYGAAPWHLLVLLASFALAGYAVSRLFGNPALLRIAIWFVGAALVWDLVLGPAYAAADRALRPLRRAGPRGVGLVNHVRVPALLSSLLLLMWSPVILQRSEGVYRAKAGLRQDDYLERWLVITAVLFALSALALGLRVLRARRRPPVDAGPQG